MHLTVTPAFSTWVVKDARFVPMPVSVSPASANGLGPHDLTVFGHGFPVGANGKIVMKSGTTPAYPTVGTSPTVPVTSASEFMAPVTFNPDTPAGQGTLWLDFGGYSYKGPRFVLTLDPVVEPPPAGGSFEGMGAVYASSGLPANRPKPGGWPTRRR